MLDFIKNWLKARNSEVIRNIVFIVAIGLVLLRAFNQNIRESIDIVNIVLFSVALLAVLREDIKDLISKIKGVGFPGLQIPIDKLEKQIENAEKQYSYSSSKYIDAKDFRKKISPKEKKEPHQSLLDITNSIEEELETIISDYNRLSKKDDIAPISVKGKTDYLLSREVIGKDIYQLTKIFLNIKSKGTTEKEDKRLYDLGVRILRLLQTANKTLNDLKINSSSNYNPFNGKPKSINLGGSRIEQVSKELIALYTTVNLLDSLETAYPIISLEEKNFKIYEKTKEGNYLVAKIRKVEPLENKIPLSVILAIDISGSMKKDNKIRFAKEAAISLVERLTQHSKLTNLRISILPFNSENNSKFLLFKNQKKWSNNFEEIKTRINKLNPKGGTPLFDALKNSIDYLKELTGYKYIICLSDGKENASTQVLKEQEIFDLGKQANIPIFSIGYGKNKNLAFLVNLASATKAGKKGIGSFMRVPPKKLIKIFGYLSGSLSHTYGIYWEPTSKEKNVDVEFKIQVTLLTNSHGEIKVDFKNNKYRLK